MYTQCPNCRTIFEIGEDALQASLGIVRCGRCLERFDALRTLSDTLPADPAALLPEHDPATHTPTLTASVAADAGTATSPAVSDAEAPASVPGIEAWIAAQAGDRARALIAEAAGLPPEAIAGDPAWQVLDVPVQAHLVEQDAGVPFNVAELFGPEPAIDGTTPALAEPLTAAWEIDAAATTTAGDGTGDARSAAGTVEPAALEAEGGALDATSHADAACADAEPDVTAEAAVPGASADPVYVPPRRHLIRDGSWIAGCVVLTLVLAGQLAWSQRGALVRNPATRARMLQACSYIDCHLPPIRAIAQLELMSRDVRHDPARANALLITATVRNNAPFRQPWPVVVVRMTDIDDNVVAMRRFAPADYLHDAAQRRTGIAPGATVAVAFAVADPGKRATGFHFGFE